MLNWKDYRPISLCNVSLKIISKILSNRLNKLLLVIISQWHTGFVPSRGIIDNVLLAQELATQIDKKLVDQNIMLKLDMEKVIV